jgi:hypothetical protein
LNPKTAYVPKPFPPQNKTKIEISSSLINMANKALYAKAVKAMGEQVFELEAADVKKIIAILKATFEEALNATVAPVAKAKATVKKAPNGWNKYVAANMTRLLKEHKEEGLTSTNCLKLIAKNWKALGTNGKAKWNADHGCAPPKRNRTKAAAEEESEEEEEIEKPQRKLPKKTEKTEKPQRKLPKKTVSLVEPEVEMEDVEKPVEPKVPVVAKVAKVPVVAAKDEEEEEEEEEEEKELKVPFEVSEEEEDEKK